MLISDKEILCFKPYLALVCVIRSWNTGKWPKMLVKFTNMYNFSVLTCKLWNRRNPKEIVFEFHGVQNISSPHRNSSSGTVFGA